MNNNKTSKRIATSDTLNFIVASCAILISGASFYATFLQADAAEKQVKAMTLPLVQFSHGNFDTEAKADAINFTFKNAGVGPAILKNVSFKYQSNIYADIYDFIKACCASENKAYLDEYNKLPDKRNVMQNGGIITAPTTGVILAGQSEYEFLKLYSHESNTSFWKKLNEQRWQLSLDICYCSMLDDCFITKNNSVFEEIESCEDIDSE